MADRGTNPKTFLTPEESQRVVQAIAAAEQGTTGEIRVRIDGRCKGPALDAARTTFHKLGMDRTAQKNGALLYLSLSDHHFAVYGDEGIHRHVGADGWNAIRDRLAARFRNDEFADGLAEAIAEIGRVLATHFPAAPGDRNELSDELSLGE